MSPTMAPPRRGQGSAAPAGPAPLPFRLGTHQHIELAGLDDSRVIPANATQLSQTDVPAYGFLRGLLILCEATGGVASVTVAAQEDAPWSAIQFFQIVDTNSAPILGPVSGYELYAVHKYGGYFFSTDPKQSPAFSAVAVGASASGNFSFLLRAPIEIVGRDCLGALPNTNAVSSYKFQVTLAPTTAIYSTAPNTTVPTIRTRVFMDAWYQPDEKGPKGEPQATVPPADGTTQYWTRNVYPVVTGAISVRSTKIGLHIRTLVLILRDSSGTRSGGETNFPDPVTVGFETRNLTIIPRTIWKHYLQAWYDYTATIETARGRDNGIFVLPFNAEMNGQPGDELRNDYLKTNAASRLELIGTLTGSGTQSLTVLTNDVAPRGVIEV